MDLNLLSSVFSSSSSPVSTRLVIVRAAMGFFFVLNEERGKLH